VEGEGGGGKVVGIWRGGIRGRCGGWLGVVVRGGGGGGRGGRGEPGERGGNNGGGLGVGKGGGQKGCGEKRREGMKGRDTKRKGGVREDGGKGRKKDRVRESETEGKVISMERERKGGKGWREGRTGGAIGVEG